MENEVGIEISKLNVNKSCGHDDMSPKLIKRISNYIVKPLTYIFNQSFLTGITPNDLNLALVTAIFKANNKQKFSNYRPISVLSCFSKIIEKLMWIRLIKYLDHNNILFHSQYSFRKKQSTNLATIELMTKISRAIDNN